MITRQGIYDLSGSIGRYTSLVLGLLLIAAGPASAIVTFPPTFETNATSNTGVDGFQSDPRGPANSGSLFSQVTTFDGSDLAGLGPALAEATAGDQGSAKRGTARVDGFFAGGDSSLSTMTARTVFTNEVTNGSGGDQHYNWNFGISGQKLTIGDSAGLSQSDDPTVSTSFSFTWEMNINSGESVQSFSYIYELVGGTQGHSLNQLGVQGTSSAFFDNGDVFGYVFPALSGNFGFVLAPGDTLSVVFTASTSMTAPALGTGGIADAGLYTSEFLVAPIPAAAWLFASALLSLFGFAGKRRTATCS